MPVPQDQTFNDDLLLAEEDRARAATIFPDLAQLFDFPELRDLFLQHDRVANQAKRYRRQMGFLAVILGMIALVGASTAPLLHEYFSVPWPSRLGTISAVFGILSVLLGTLGFVSSKPKVRWLSHRTMTERLRQLHFQILVCRMPTVLASMKGRSECDKFLELRRRWLATLVQRYERHPIAQLNTILHDDTEDEVWVLQPDPWDPPEAMDSHLEEIFAAYRVFRLEHQRQYANYKVRRDERYLFNSSAWQLQWLRFASLFSIMIILIVHIGVAISLSFNWSVLAQDPWMHVSVVWLAIIAIAARSLEEGLQPAREVERYSRYRAMLNRLVSEFDRTTTPQGKHRVMFEMERLVYQELRDFLTLHEEARFAL